MDQYEFVITIDVGETTALAWWKPEYGRSGKYGLYCTESYALYEYRRTCLWLQDAATRLKKHLPSHCRIDVWIEGVRVYPSLKSQTAALRGDLTKLSMLVGAYAAILPPSARGHIVPPSAYRGQLTKEQVRARLERLGFGCAGKNEHQRDAIYLGVSVLWPGKVGLMEGWNEGL